MQDMTKILQCTLLAKLLKINILQNKIWTKMFFEKNDHKILLIIKWKKGKITIV